MTNHRAKSIRRNGGTHDEEICLATQGELPGFAALDAPNNGGAKSPHIGECVRSAATSKLKTALGYAQRGWPVFPCKPGGKRPTTRAGFKDASTDPQQITAWWHESPQANIGVATGAAGLVVIDVDVKNGAPGLESWQALLDELGPEIGETAVARTPSGGRHYVYRANGHSLRNSVGKLAPGLDVRAEDGYVVAPGSETPEGSYVWMTDCEPAELPATLAERLTIPDRAPAEPLAEAAIPVGERNATLTSLAGTMRRRGMSEQAIAAALREENRRCAVPLPEPEVDAIAASVASYEPAAADAAGEGDPLVHEAAHAAVLKAEWRDQYRWAQHESAWRHWTGRVWKAVAEPVVVAAAQKVLRRHYGHLLAQKQSPAEDKRLRTLHGEACRYTSVLGGLSFLKGESGFQTEVEEWDSDAYRLNCADGLLDLRRQELGVHDPEALCTKITRWTFADRESSGAWERHLARCLPMPTSAARYSATSVVPLSAPTWRRACRSGTASVATASRRRHAHCCRAWADTAIGLPPTFSSRAGSSSTPPRSPTSSARGSSSAKRSSRASTWPKLG